MAPLPLAERLDWLDTARGAGIILVVLGHVIGGLRDAGLLPTGGLADRLFFFIYSFHMPVFFWLAGTLAPKRISSDPGRFALHTLTHVVWPYFLWCTLQSMVGHLASGHTTRQYAFGPERALALLWEPAAQFWFLYSLALLHLSALALSRLPAPLALGVGCVISLAGYVWDGNNVLAWTMQVAWCYYWGVACAARCILPGGPELRGFTLPVSGLLLAGCAVYGSLARHIGAQAGSGWVILPATVCGMLGFLLPCRQYGHGQSFLAMLGRHAMGIYVMHVMIVAGVRIICVKFLNMTSALPVLPMQMAAGLIIPLICTWLARRYRINRLLGLG